MIYGIELKQGRVHERKGLEYMIVKGRALFSRVAYACVITQNTAHEGVRAIYHVEEFYGQNGIKTRAEACRYGRALPGRFRVPRLSSCFPRVELEREREPRNLS